MTFAEVGVRFNVENIYYFPSCSGGTISLHSRSLLNFPLDIWNPGGGGGGETPQWEGGGGGEEKKN